MSGLGDVIVHYDKISRKVCHHKIGDVIGIMLELVDPNPAETEFITSSNPIDHDITQS